MVELLVAMGIFMVILAAVTTSWIRTSDLVGGMVVKSDLVEDVRNASAIIADGVTRAVYVYPPGTRLTLNINPGQLLRNPVDGSNIFIVGNYVGSKMSAGSTLGALTTTPIIAFLEAEKNPSADCATNQEGCLTFIAYYFARRGTLTAPGQSFDFIDNPANSDKWMLLEYRNVMTFDSDALANLSLPVQTRGGQANLLVDYIDPEYLLMHYQDCATGEVNDPLRPCPATTPLGSGDVKLSVFNGVVHWRAGISRQNGRRQYLSPEIPFAIVPENLINQILR